MKGYYWIIYILCTINSYAHAVLIKKDCGAYVEIQTRSGHNLRLRKLITPQHTIPVTIQARHVHALSQVPPGTRVILLNDSMALAVNTPKTMAAVRNLSYHKPYTFEQCARETILDCLDTLVYCCRQFKLKSE